MKPVFTAEEMRFAENSYFAKGVSSLTLMERAAGELARRVLMLLPKDGTCAFACGSGGNGGDGYAAARLLSEKGVRTVILQASKPRNPDAVTNCERAKSTVFAISDTSALERLPKPDVWVDCLFGIGLSRAPDENHARLIQRINEDHENGSLVISCDLPSGLNADTGETPGECVWADETVTFQVYKRGLLLQKGVDFCGNVTVADIGISEDCYPSGAMRLVEDEDVKSVLPKRLRSAHKNDFGHLLIVAGSLGMAGAAAITALSALRSGAGLVTVACPESIEPILQTLVPCAMCIPLPEKDGALSDEALGKLESAIGGKSALAVGPGLTLKCSEKCIRFALECGVKAVFDADALNIIGRNADLKALLKPCHAVTPHPGEAARLLGEKLTDACLAAERLSLCGCAALVKGPCSVIKQKGLFISSSGCTGMAKGGSGDALTGIVGALLAQGLDCETALWAASQLHGRAGEKAQEKYGTASMLASDLVSCIGEVL